MFWLDPVWASLLPSQVCSCIGSLVYVSPIFFLGLFMEAGIAEVLVEFVITLVMEEPAEIFDLCEVSLISQKDIDPLILFDIGEAE